MASLHLLGSDLILNIRISMTVLLFD